MSSREEILNHLRTNVRETYDKPCLDFKQKKFADPVSEFKRELTTAAASRWIDLQDGDDINAKILEAYPDAGLICGNVAGLKADVNPDKAVDAMELEGIDVGVVEGGVSCAENACIWVPMNMLQKAVCFMAERLIIIINERDIVSNMHEAYAVLESMGQTSRYGFGSFISGPSKTADIEQSLVFGAQAAKELTVFIKVNLKK